MMERRIAWLLVAAGVIVALALSPPDRGLQGFAWNFSFYWGPQGLVLTILLASKPRPAVVAGAALAMALHLLAFDAWIRAHGPAQTLGWLHYLFSFPGALAGAVSAVLVSRRLGRSPARVAGAFAAALTAIGIAVNHGFTRLTQGFGL
jgi:hypothetical protein